MRLTPFTESKSNQSVLNVAPLILDKGPAERHSFRRDGSSFDIPVHSSSIPKAGLDMDEREGKGRF